MKTPWEPINFHGRCNYDPRGEIRDRARRVEPYDDYVAIPLSLAFALADLHECDSTTVLTYDEYGPMPPLTVRCKKMVGHRYQHSNGYASWDTGGW